MCGRKYLECVVLGCISDILKSENLKILCATPFQNFARSRLLSLQLLEYFPELATGTTWPFQYTVLKCMVYAPSPLFSCMCTLFIFENLLEKLREKQRNKKERKHQRDKPHIVDEFKMGVIRMVCR